jgi:hypothetical protein
MAIEHQSQLKMSRQKDVKSKNMEFLKSFKIKS